MTTTMPPGIPVLDRGKHRVPADGACLMEYVSVLAGAPFSDHPRCTHPLLGWLARRVNDRVVERACLTVLAPALIGTRVRGPRARGRVRAVVYGELAGMALTVAPGDPWLRGLCGPRRPLGLIDRNHVFERVCEVVGDLDPAHRDRLLGAVLTDSVTRVRRELGLPDVDVESGAVLRL